MLWANVRRTIDQTRWKLKGLRVYALVGKAGTGKSFRARLIADSQRLEAIIDDGLLIVNGKIVAGRSAKQDQHYLGAIKTALFHDPNDREVMKRAIRESGIAGILLLGTSERMVRRNCLSLALPEPREILRIEDLVSAEELETARSQRRQGKHVIPIPVVEVQQAYPKLWARAMKVLFERGIGKLSQKSYDKTEVRPVYSQDGGVSISENALAEMIVHCFLEKMPGVEVRKIRILVHEDSYEARLHVALPFGQEVAQSCHDLREYAVQQVESYTGIRIKELLIRVDSVMPRASGSTNN